MTKPDGTPPPPTPDNNVTAIHQKLVHFAFFRFLFLRLAFSVQRVKKRFRVKHDTHLPAGPHDDPKSTESFTLEHVLPYRFLSAKMVSFFRIPVSGQALHLI